MLGPVSSVFTWQDDTPLCQTVRQSFAQLSVTLADNTSSILVPKHRVESFHLHIAVDAWGLNFRGFRFPKISINMLDAHIQEPNPNSTGQTHIKEDERQNGTD